MIKSVYDLGVTGALNIIYALRDKKVENIPSQRQIYNFLYEYKQELYGTFRERVPFSQFIERLKIILNRFSTDKLSLKKFKEETDISEFWKKAIEYLNKKPKIKFDQYEDAYLLSLDHQVDFERYVEILACDENCYIDGECEFVSCMNFDSFVEFTNLIRVVRFNELDWKFSICTCKDYHKSYMCKHIIVIALHKKSITIPEKYYDTVIGSKPKPGRKKKAQDWHIIQNN